MRIYAYDNEGRELKVGHLVSYEGSDFYVVEIAWVGRAVAGLESIEEQQCYFNINCCDLHRVSDIKKEIIPSSFYRDFRDHIVRPKEGIVYGATLE